jgi:hypothetical protein
LFKLEKKMKALFTYFLLTLTITGARGETASARSEVPRQVEGNVAYYVVPELKQIWLELPYRLKGSLISADDTHALNIFAERDKNLDRNEIVTIRQRYPGYKFREAGVVGRNTVEIDLGISKKIALAEDPSGRAGFFSAQELLTTSEARALKSKIQTHQIPIMKLSVKRAVPFEKIIESFELPTRKICDQLVEAAKNQTVRFSRGLSILHRNLSSELKLIRSARIIDQAFDSIVESCVTLEENQEAKVGRISLSFTSKNANQVDLLKESTIEEVVSTTGAVVESEWSIL